MTDVGKILLIFRCTIDGIYPKPLYIMKAHPVPQYALSYKPPRLQYLIQTISQNPPPCNPLPLIDPRRLTSSTKQNSTSCNCMVFVLQRTGFVLHINPHRVISVVKTPFPSQHKQYTQIWTFMSCYYLILWSTPATQRTCTYVTDIHPHISNGWTPISLKRFMLMIASTYRGFQNMFHLLKEKICGVLSRMHLIIIQTPSHPYKPPFNNILHLLSSYL